MRNFIGVDLGGESVPDATTLLKFRHLLEENDLTQAIFEEIGKHLQAKKLLMKEGTIVDATIINAPSSTKNAKGKRDPQMHQTRKGHQWYFGMKAHIGADAESGLVHSLVATPANVSDVSQTKHLLHGEEKKGRLTSMAEGLRKDLLREWERRKAQVRSKVEHPFLLIKNLFGYRQVRYRGLRKNLAQLHRLCALANLVIAGRMLRRAQMA